MATLANKKTETVTAQTEIAVTPINIETLTYFVTPRVAKPILLSNESINTNASEDSRLQALKDKGIKSFTGGGTVTVEYFTGKKELINAALGVAGLYAQVTLTNPTESFCVGKFASRGREIVLPSEQVESINAARMHHYEENVKKKTIAAFESYIADIGASQLPDIQLPLLWELFSEGLTASVEAGELWIVSQADKLEYERIIAVETRPLMGKLKAYKVQFAPSDTPDQTEQKTGA